MSGLRFSVVMPAYQAEALLPATLGALKASDLPREQWELIVVDDGSRDGTAEVARKFADRVLSLPAPNRGPGGARNEAAKLANAPWLVFIDADVGVHPDTLSRMAERIDREPGLVALFGTYDDAPAAKGVVTEYRNLLHRYVHGLGAGEAETFWAGCGAVQKEAFVAVGGFDTARYPRPQIEDIELGYRLRDRGGRIVNDPTVQARHLKRWTVSSVLRTDLLDRGIPWMRLLLERRHLGNAGTLNTGGKEKLKVALAGAVLASLLGGLFDARCFGIAAVLLVHLAAANFATYRWFASQRGVAFALAVVPLHLVHYLSNAVAAAAGIFLHFTSRVR